MIARDAAALYLSRGWAPIPIPWREKNPGYEGWQNLRVTPETLGEYFNGVRQNIRVLLGEPSGGLVDADLDCREALQTADYFLPDTGSIFGRASSPSSHRLFVANCPTKKFTDPTARDLKKAMLVELRSTGAQTVFPDSVHKETGEAIEWKCDNGPAEIDGAQLTRLMGLVAASALVARYWPSHARHDASLALSGALRHSGWSLEQTKIFVNAVVEAAGDEEATDRIRAARDTYTKETPTTGWPRLAEILGEPIIGRLRDWLGVGRQASQEAPVGEEPFYSGGNGKNTGAGNSEADQAAGSARQQIQVRAGDLPRIVEDAIKALRGAAVPIYDRGGALYRPVLVESPPKDDDHVRRPVGAVVLRPVDPAWARLQLAGAAQWRKWDARDKKMRPADPPKDIGEIVATQSDLGNWPVLRGVASHPVLTAKGRVLSTPGYDQGSGLLIEITGDWPIPDAPTRDDAVAAWERLKNLLRYFPWAGDVDRAVALSMFLTAIARPALPVAPMHAVDAPEAGTGKSLLVDAASILASGAEAPVMDYGSDPVEAGKRLDAMLLAADPVIALDNIEAPIEGATLCQTLTQTGAFACWADIRWSPSRACQW
jgi:hypothetical protein